VNKQTEQRSVQIVLVTELQETENKGILIQINLMIPITHNYTKCFCLDLKSGKIHIVHVQILYSEPKHFHHTFEELCFCLQPHSLAYWITITLLHAKFQNLKLHPSTILNNTQLQLSDKYVFNGMFLDAVGILAQHKIPGKVTGVTTNILKNSGALRI
jgi:hypothetical protein